MVSGKIKFAEHLFINHQKEKKHNVILNNLKMQNKILKIVKK